MSNSNYQRLPESGTSHQEWQTSEDHELQDLNNRREDEVNLLSSFSNDDGDEFRAAVVATEENRYNDSRTINEQNNTVQRQLPQQGNDTNLHESGSRSSLPQTNEQSQSSGRPQLQIPNTIIHRLINNPRVSRYVPHLLRSYYRPVYSGRPMGEGLNNDGVFRNMSAKPSTNQELDESLPSYEQLALDTSPPYWESSVISPGFEDEVFVDGLPVGSILNFIWNFTVSFSFQFIGFFLTYLLHTSHGSKEGSRAGLGSTFINFGYGLLPVNYYNKSDTPISKFEPNDPNSIDVDGSQTLDGHFYSSSDSSQSASKGMVEDANGLTETAKAPVIAFALIALGLLILLKSIIDYHRARQMEWLILNPVQPGTTNTTNTTTTTTTTTTAAVTDPRPEEV